MLKELPFNKNDILGYTSPAANRLQLHLHCQFVFGVVTEETLPYSTLWQLLHKLQARLGCKTVNSQQLMKLMNLNF